MQPVSRLRGQCRSRPCYQYGPILRNASSAGRHFRCAPLDVRPRGAGAGGPASGDVERRQPPAARHRLAGGVSLRWLSIVKRGCRAMSEVGGKAEIICSLRVFRILTHSRRRRCARLSGKRILCGRYCPEGQWLAGRKSDAILWEKPPCQQLNEGEQ